MEQQQAAMVQGQPLAAQRVRERWFVEGDQSYDWLVDMNDLTMMGKRGVTKLRCGMCKGSASEGYFSEAVRVEEAGPKYYEHWHYLVKPACKGGGKCWVLLCSGCDRVYTQGASLYASLSVRRLGVA